MRAAIAVLGVICGVWVTIRAADADTSPLACGKVAAQIDAILAREPPGTVTTLRSKLLTCFGAHRICGVVYDHTEAFAHVFSGEQSSDVPTVEYFVGGASYAFMASRSLPRSSKSGLEYCLALTPDGHGGRGEFDWYGWQISATGEVVTLDLSMEPSFGIHTNPRSLAIALWNLYQERF
jgi:hypothetical protein